LAGAAIPRDPKGTVMSTIGQAPGDQHRARGARDRKAGPKTIAAAVLAALVTLFAVLNSQTVRVHFIVTTTRVPMIVVIAVCAVIGVVVGWLIARRRAARGAWP
jgi:uncharacterized integral membrane protein